MAFNSPFEKLHTSALDLRYTFFFTFPITRLFSAWTCLNTSQLSFVPSFIQIFLSFLAFIWAFLQFSSNLGIDLAQSFILRIEVFIAILMAFARFLRTVCINKTISIFASRYLKSPSLSIICNIYSNQIS